MNNPQSQRNQQNKQQGYNNPDQSNQRGANQNRRTESGKTGQQSSQYKNG